MPRIATPHLAGRRALALGVAGVLVAARRDAAAQGARVATPPQMTGPFYPPDWSGDADADLVRVTGAAAAAQGVVLHLRGRVLDVTGRPVPGAVVEIWQCDAHGFYRHPGDRPGVRDAGFQGRGRLVAGGDGGFAFRTIRPVAYPGRTPHIHVRVAAPGRAGILDTQLYVAGDPANERDGLFARLRDADAREAVLLRPEPADRLEQGTLLAERDLVLG